MADNVSSVPVFLDTDLGVDDALALYYLLASPEADLVGIGTVSGNISADQALRNSLDLLALAGRPDIPVALGARDFLTHRFEGGVEHIHGKNGLGGIEVATATQPASKLRAHELLSTKAREYPGKLRLITIGPLTNIAYALESDPELAQLVHSVTVMGGAALTPGNITPAGEANIWNDPEAAAKVFAAQWDITMVGLDITMKETLEPDLHHRLLQSPNPLAKLLGDIGVLYANFYNGIFGRPATALHDPLAAAIAIGTITPTLAPRVRVEVDTSDGPCRGRTVADMRGMYNAYPEQRGAHCTVVLEINEPFAPHMVSRLESLRH